MKTGYIYFHLASLYKDMEQFEEATEYLNKSKKIFYNIYKTDNIHTARLMTVEAEILFNKEDYKNALSLYKKSFEILKK